MAVHHAVQMHHLSSQVARQNTSRIITPPRAQVAEVVGEIVEVAPTTEDLQRFIDIVSREVDDPGLEYATVETEKPVVVMSPDQLEQVIDRVVEQVERDEQPEPPPTTAAPDCSRTRLSGRVSARAYCGSRRPCPKPAAPRRHREGPAGPCTMGAAGS
jgi:hypothetical protein